MNAAIEKLMASPIEHLGYRVITLAMMDEAHERPPGTAGRAFRANRHRLTEGRHYFTAAPIDEIRRSLGAPNGKGKAPVLLTERGYFVLVKTFHDDRAWRVQEQLVEGYFRARSARLDPLLDLVLRRLDSIEANQWGFQHALNARLMAKVDELERGQKRLRGAMRHGLFGRQSGRQGFPRPRGGGQTHLFPAG